MSETILNSASSTKDSTPCESEPQDVRMVESPPGTTTVRVEEEEDEISMDPAEIPAKTNQDEEDLAAEVPMDEVETEAAAAAEAGVIPDSLTADAPMTDDLVSAISAIQTTKEDEIAVEEVLETVISNSSNNIQPADEDCASPSSEIRLDYDDDEDSNDQTHDNKAENGTAIMPVKEQSNDKGMGDNSDMNVVQPDISQPNEDNEIEYIVERVVDKKIDSRGFVKYLVKWQNFSSKDNSWEPLEHLVDCDLAMREFEVSRAQKLSERLNNDQNDTSSKDKVNGAALKRRMMLSNHKEFEVNDVMGITVVNEEKYFLVSLANSTQKAFIRATLANSIFPSKVIDFYIKNVRWKPRVDELLV